MAEEKMDPVSLMDLKISELTEEQKRTLRVPVGIEGLPYPMVMDVPSDDGKVEQRIGVVDSAANGMAVYTEMPIERVQGKLFREMPVPSMMRMLRDLLSKQAPDSKNRIFTVFGDPAFGKSFLFKSVAGIVHPKGAIHVDCGGMNMREIFFRTVIDYGNGVQDVLDKRMAEGKVSQETIAYLNGEFPGAVVTRNGRSAIDWDSIGAPQKDGSGAITEDRGASFERAARVMKNVYDKENIGYQSNSFGIKTVPGEFFEALWSGRPLFLDEFNKSKRGTLDAWQTALQFLNGEESSVTIYNPMSESASDDTMKAITVTRADIKPGFIVGVAGNESRDGDTTQELSESMMTRLNPMYVGNATIRDWEHRISQIWTGLPVVTLHSIFQDFAANNPAEFAEFLLELRTMGLSQREAAAIPQEEMYFLQNWQDTVQAVRQVAAYYEFRQQLGNPESALFDRGEYQNLADEISSEAEAKIIKASFRKVIADHRRAMEGALEVRAIEQGSSLKPNIRQALNPAHLAGTGAPEAPWHHFGANLAQAIVEDIINVTKDKPLVRAALLEECKKRGIVAEVFKEARPSGSVKTLAELMRYDELKDIGGSDELKALQSIVVTALRAIDPKIQKADDQLVPLRSLGTVMAALGTDAPSSRQVVIPNDDLNNVTERPLVAVEAVASYNYEESPGDEAVDFRTLLAGMAMADFAAANRGELWLKDLPSSTGLDEEEARVSAALKGEPEARFHMGIVSAVNAADETIYLYVLEDTESQKMIVVGPEEIPVQMSTALSKNGVTYLLKTAPGTKDTVDDFLTRGVRTAFDGEDAPPVPEDGNNADTKTLINAFATVCALPPQHTERTASGQVMAKGKSTFGDLLATSVEGVAADGEETPRAYTLLVKKGPGLKL